MNRSNLLDTLRIIGVTACAGLVVQACAFSSHDPTGTSSSMLGGGDAGVTTEGGSASEGGSSPYIYIYIFRRNLTSDRHHSIGLSRGASETVEFTWHNAAGAAPPSDLWIEAGDKKVLQVAAVNDAPFVRAGLDVVELVPDAKYRAVFQRGDESIGVTILDAADHVVLSTHADAPAADLVLPAPFWRTSVTADLK